MNDIPSTPTNLAVPHRPALARVSTWMVLVDCQGARLWARIWLAPSSVLFWSRLYKNPSIRVSGSNLKPRYLHSRIVDCPHPSSHPGPRLAGERPTQRSRIRLRRRVNQRPPLPIPHHSGHGASSCRG